MYPCWGLICVGLQAGVASATALANNPPLLAGINFTTLYANMASNYSARPPPVPLPLWPPARLCLTAAPPFCRRLECTD